MSKNTFYINYLPWDSKFFNLKIGKIICKKYDIELINNSIESWGQKGYDLIYFIINDKIDKKLILKKYLFDQKVTFYKNINDSLKKPKKIKQYKKSEIDPKLYKLAIQSGKYSRFKKDSNFKFNQFKNLYKTWIRKSVKKIIADNVYVYKKNKSIQGMITIKIKNNSGKIGLISVDKNSRSSGIGSKLINSAEYSLLEKGINRISVDTQMDNIAACKFYKKNGYIIESINNYYHIWTRDHANTLQ